MATIAKQRLEVAKTMHNGPPLVLPFPEAAGQSFQLGEFVYLVGGKVTVCGADPTDILGIALKAASGTANTEILVAIATADTIFSGNLNGTVTAVTQVGESFGVTLASNKWHVDTAKLGTSVRTIVVGLDTRDTVGDTSGRVLFIVMSKYRQIDTTS